MNTRPPVIAHVLHRLDRAGAEVLAGDLATQLKGRYRFIFLCLDAVGSLGEQLAQQGLPVIPLGRQPGLDWKVARRIRQQVKAHQISLLHAHQYTPFFYAALSRRLGSRPPILFTEHGRHYPDQRHPKRVLANRFLLKPTDRVTAVGRFVKQALVDNEGIPEARIRVIHNGIDPDRFPPADDRTRRQARAELGLGPDTPVIMQVARFHPVKDHATSIRAFASVVGTFPDARLCLVGDGPKRQEMQQLVETLGLGDRVMFLGVRPDVNQLLPAADVFVLSSLSEGISVTLLEAMATGLPIAATDVGGNGEVVEHEQTGLLSPRGDDAALANHLIALLQDADRRRAMGRAGRQRLLDQFTQPQMHQGYTEIYEQLLPA